MAQAGSLVSAGSRGAASLGRGAPRSQVWPVHFARSAPLGAAAIVVLLILVLVAIFAAQLAPYDPLKNNYAVARQPPSAAHWLGTDTLGRDVLTRIMFGLRISLLVSVASILLGVSIGVLWGVTSGYIGGGYDLVSQRLVEVLASFPTLILAMLLSVALGPGLGTVIIAVGVTQVPLATRITRSVVLGVKQTQFVEAARCVGATRWRIMWRQVAPQCVAPVMVVATLNLGAAIFAEAALSFLGVGVPPPTPSLGNMLGGVLAQSFQPPWWLVVFPGAVIALTVLAANLLGDALRDVLDPKLRHRLQ
jgi:ABC-type dipeptide/oligopeptide/nickel transport system permease subunit